MVISTLPALSAGRAVPFPGKPGNTTFRPFPAKGKIQAALAYTSAKSGQDLKVLASQAGQDTLDPGLRCPDPGVWEGPRSPDPGPQRPPGGLWEASSPPGQAPWAWSALAPGDLDAIQHLSRIRHGGSG